MISRVVQAEGRSSSCPAADGDGGRTTSRSRASTSPRTRSRPTQPESDGTLEWDSTTIVVVEAARRRRRAGSATRTPPRRRRTLIDEQLARRRARRATRSTCGASGVDGRARCATSAGRGSASCALSAVDIALWDLKRACSACRSSTLLGLRTTRVPVYGSGGFCSYTARAARRAARRLGRAGHPAREDEGRTRARAPTRARLDAAREAIGDDASSTSTRTARFSRKEALRWARRYDAELGRALVRGAGLLRRPRGLRARPRPRARRARRRRGRVRATCRATSQRCSAGASTACRPTSPAAAASPACSRVAGALRTRTTLDLSAHCAPQLSAHAFCGVDRAAPPRVLPRPRAGRADALRRRARAGRRRAAARTARGPGTASS